MKLNRLVDNSSLETPAALHFSVLPLQERVLDRLADLMLGADEVLDMLAAGDAASMRWAEPHLRIVYDEINGVMKRICD